jgi:hypothetical protein
MNNTSCEFIIETKDPKRGFSQFLSRGRGETIAVLKSDFSFSESLSEELLNEEFSIVVSEGTLSDITGENIFERVHRCEKFGFDISKEIQFIVGWIKNQESGLAL